MVTPKFRVCGAPTGTPESGERSRELDRHPLHPDHAGKSVTLGPTGSEEAARLLAQITTAGLDPAATMVDLLDAVTAGRERPPRRYRGRATPDRTRLRTHITAGQLALTRSSLYLHKQGSGPDRFHWWWHPRLPGLGDLPPAQVLDRVQPDRRHLRRNPRPTQGGVRVAEIGRYESHSLPTCHRLQTVL